jgi:hypothetical protein
MNDDFKGMEKSIDDAGSGCLMLVLFAIIFIIYNVIF